MSALLTASTGAERSAPVRCRSTAYLLLWSAAAFLLGGNTAFAVEDGSPAPAFTLPTFGSKAPVSLAQFKGKVVFVDFWASWCEPCRQSLPLYDKLNQELGGKDFTILAVNLDEEDADAAGFLKEHPVQYTVLRDPAGDVPKSFGLIGMPTSYLIDQRGVVRSHHIGFNPSYIDTLRKEIHALLETHGDAK